MLRLLTILALLIPISTQAADLQGFPTIFFDKCESSSAQQCPSNKDLLTYGALAVTECWYGSKFMPKDQLFALDTARRLLRMKPYSQGTCVAIGVVPDDLIRGARDN